MHHLLPPAGLAFVYRALEAIWARHVDVVTVEERRCSHSRITLCKDTWSCRWRNDLTPTVQVRMKRRMRLQTANYPSYSLVLGCWMGWDVPLLHISTPASCVAIEERRSLQRGELTFKAVPRTAAVHLRKSRYWERSPSCIRVSTHALSRL